MSNEILGRILARAKELGLSPRAASLAADMGATAIRDMINKPDTSPSMATIQKFAVGLKTTPEWLAFGLGEVADQKAEKPVTEPYQQELVKAAYAGVVEAGSFRPVADFEDDPERDPIYVPRDPQFPQADLFIFDVAGDSMNDLKPSPILPNTRVLCVGIEKVRIPMRQNMVVVVEQVINDGHLRERSVKQVEDFEDRVEFHPRSRNPKHKPIVVAKDLEADDGRSVAVIGIVRNIISTVPLG